MSDQEEGRFGLEGEISLEGELSSEEDTPEDAPIKAGSNLSTRRQKKMLELLDLVGQRVKEPDFNSKLETSVHKLNDFTLKPATYARQQRITLTVSRAGRPEIKKNLSGYVLVEHRDQFDTHAAGQRILVESDKTVFVIVGHVVDQKNIIGRNMRKTGVEPISTLRDTLSDFLEEITQEKPSK